MRDGMRKSRLSKAKQGSEIDCSGLHIVMLYSMEGIAYWETDGTDPYELDGYDNTERMRQLLKLVLLISINAKTKSTHASPWLAQHIQLTL
jgi:hypothetical protein